MPSGAPMLLGLFKNVNWCVLDPPKVIHFCRIRYGCGNIFEELGPIRVLPIQMLTKKKKEVVHRLLICHALNYFSFPKKLVCVELLAARSAKLAALLKENPEDDLSHLLGDIPTDSQTFELVARFCYGSDINLSPENVIKVLCLAHYLGMSEIHSTNNLVKKACFYFQNNILPSWNKCIKALKSAETILQQAADLSLVDACAESIITKVLHDPGLL
ncbi:BTB/POZ domain-containing protein At5g17580 [Lycium barbarum]|uniref:BTB/POZ domain-containing protein At5g17580 n=1 Tax=Lycium barbarum TaxID=112863 RepID=UPI00293E9EA5|nr:BTB/POZ domain-containing protein At5g17580 [Lycium barbarum]